MELLFCLVISAVVGAVILSRYNKAGTGFLLGGLLGPIGWIVALVMRGNAASEERKRQYEEHRAQIQEILVATRQPTPPDTPNTSVDLPHLEIPSCQPQNATEKDSKGAIRPKTRGFPLAATIGIGAILLLLYYCFTHFPGNEKSDSVKTDQHASEKSDVVLPNYTILNERFSDAPIKTQVISEALVTGNITDLSLKALLDNLYAHYSAKKGFKYHDSPTSIWIYLYTSKEHASSGMGQWIAMAAKSHDAAAPTLTINQRQVAAVHTKPQHKFGLSEEKRQQVWKDIVRAEDRANKEAELRYPIPDTLGSAQYYRQIQRWGDYKDKLIEKDTAEVAKKYGLTVKQLDEIGLEGAMKQWAFPAQQ
jgi:hypothetical protein